MEKYSSPIAIPILLGRPFLKTTNTKIDLNDGLLTMEFDEEKTHFNIYEAMRYPSDMHSLCAIDVIDSLAQQVLDLYREDGVEVIIREAIVKVSEISSITIDEAIPTSLETQGIEVVSVPPSGDRELFYMNLPINNENFYLL